MPYAARRQTPAAKPPPLTGCQTHARLPAWQPRCAPRPPAARDAVARRFPRALTRPRRQRKNRVFSIISDKMAVTQASKCRKFRAKDSWPRRALPCLVPGSTLQTPPRVLPSQKICHQRRSFDAVATSSVALVRTVGRAAFVTVWLRASCMTWAIWFRRGLATSIWSTRGTAAPCAARSSTQTRRTTLCPRPITRIASFPWPCDWSWRMACPIKRPVGICGATTGFLSPSPRSKTGWRPGEKGGPPNVDDLPRLGPG